MKAVLKIYGDIGISDPMMELFGMGDTMIGAKEVSEFIEANKEATEIDVRINSRGGDVQEGWAIYDLLTTSGKKIKTIGEGRVYSIATIVFLAGAEREMLKNADGLIHNPYIPPYTLADAYESGDLLKIAESLKQEEEKILDFYAEKTGTDKAKLAEYMKEETKLSAEDMVTLGFATKVVEPIKAYAYIKPNIMTKDEEKRFFERLGSILDNAVAKVAGFSRLPSKAMELTDKDGNVLKVEKEEGSPAVGDTASPDGTFNMPDGKVITVSGGVITEITDAPEETEDSEKDQKISDLEKQVNELTEQLAAVNAAKDAFEVEKTALATSQAEASALVEELRAIKNEWKPEGRSQVNGTTNEKALDLDRVKAILAEINKK
jgi:ATP-dependent Clp protease protease subunit